MKKKLLSFKFFYIVYVVILAVLIFVAVLHVRSVLEEYEAALPEKKVEAAMEQLLSDAETGKFWTKYFLPKMWWCVVDFGNFLYIRDYQIKQR